VQRGCQTFGADGLHQPVGCGHYNDVMSQDPAPKSAVELAMERLRKKDEAAGVTETRLTDAQKTAIAELRSLYGARLAQADLQYKDRLRATFDPAVHEAFDLEYRRERERLTGELDAKIEQARRQAEP
jgi:hypothetical protein